VVARTDATVYELGRQRFLTAVLGHAATERQAGRIAEVRLAASAGPVSDRTPEAGAAEPG